MPTQSKVNQQEHNVTSLVDTINKFTNPFDIESDQFVKFVAKDHEKSFASQLWMA